MEAHTLEQELESTLESVDSAEQIVLAEAEALGLDDDDLFGAIYTFQCGLQLPFQGVRLHTLLVRSKNETTYLDHVWQVEPLH